MALSRPGFMTERVSHWNSPNKVLANKGKLFSFVFLRGPVLCFVAELWNCDSMTSPFSLIISLHK